MPKTIELSKGYKATVDDDLYDWLSQWKWHAHVDWTGIVYAARCRRVAEEPGPKIILMHIVVYGNRPRKADEIGIDHIDLDGLNNQLANLRPASIAQQNMNRKPSSKLGYKGVYFEKRSKRNPYCARIKHNGKTIHLGNFPTLVEAARAYDEAARRLFGPFARCNFPLMKDAA